MLNHLKDIVSIYKLINIPISLRILKYLNNRNTKVSPNIT